MSVTVEQEAFQMPMDNKKVMLKIDDVHLHSCGVFSNVYRGNLREPCEKKIAIKKTWPEKGERNFEFIFLTGRERTKHKNIIQMSFAFSHNYGNKVCESYVFDYMPLTLSDVIRQHLDDLDIRLYTWQIFAGLKYLEEHCVIHRDLKPVNILVDHDTGNLKISDFGSAKVHIRNKQSNSYQVTRFYRPPELCLKSTEYDATIDVWSAGCCVAEMIRKNVVFPGRDSSHQLKLLCRCFGCPTESDMIAMKTTEKLEPEHLKYTKGYGLAKVLPDATREQVSFLRKVLVYAPEKRLKGRDLLKDDFFKPLFRSGAVRSNEQPVSSTITPADYKKATNVEDASTRRLALLSLALKPLDPQGQGIPVCEKSNSFENIPNRRSTLVPREQKMAKDMKSKEDMSREKEEKSNDRKRNGSNDKSDERGGNKKVVKKRKSAEGISSNNGKTSRTMTKITTEKVESSNEKQE